jgi:hypothetical protein
MDNFDVLLPNQILPHGLPVFILCVIIKDLKANGRYSLRKPFKNP